MLIFNNGILDASSRPTPDEVYHTALIVGTMADILDALSDAQMDIEHLRGALRNGKHILSACADILDVGLDVCAGKTDWQGVKW